MVESYIMDSVSISNILKTIDGAVICAGSLENDHIKRAFASDLMSDVLTLNTDSLLLITGLANMMTIRTAEMAEIKNILFVRGKKPSTEMIELAKQEGINLYSCSKSMYATCGLLFKDGIKAVY